MAPRTDHKALCMGGMILNIAWFPITSRNNPKYWIPNTAPEHCWVRFWSGSTSGIRTIKFFPNLSIFGWLLWFQKVYFYDRKVGHNNLNECSNSRNSTEHNQGLGRLGRRADCICLAPNSKQRWAYLLRVKRNCFCIMRCKAHKERASNFK